MQIPNMPISKDQQDVTPHGSFEFPFVIYENVMSHNLNNTIDWHWHDDLQLCYILKGDSTVYLSGSSISLKEGEGAFINSGFLHMIRAEQDPDSIFVCINFHYKLLGLFEGSIFQRKYLSPFLKNPAFASCSLRPGTPWQEEILDGIRSLIKIDQHSSPGYEYQVLLLLIRIWFLFTENHVPDASQKSLHTMVKGDAAAQAIMAYIHNHYTENISIDQIADAVSFSPSECCRIFKRVTKSTIFSYLRFYRITKSTELLSQTQMSVSDIAYECGFSSTSYFIENFRKHTGMTPLQFRKH